MKKLRKIFENKVVSIIYKIIKAITTVILLMVLFIIILQRFSDNNLAVGGLRVFCVVSKSMAPKYDIGDILFTKKVPAEKIVVGDDVTYLGNKGDFNGMVVTHKVISKTKEEGKYLFTTKGLANDVVDPEISYDQIYGKVMYRAYLLSFISKLINNIVINYIVFTIVGLIASIQVVRIVFQLKEESDDNEKGEK